MGQIAAAESFIELHGSCVQGTSISVEQEEGKAKNTTRYVTGHKDAIQILVGRGRAGRLALPK